jgi:hypothetical protein
MSDKYPRPTWFMAAYTLCLLALEIEQNITSTLLNSHHIRSHLTYRIPYNMPHKPLFSVIMLCYVSTQSYHTQFLALLYLWNYYQALQMTHNLLCRDTFNSLNLLDDEVVHATNVCNDDVITVHIEI